ncbi:MAG: glycosyltransferase family 39 protein [Rhodomicrobium sp.]
MISGPTGAGVSASASSTTATTGVRLGLAFIGLFLLIRVGLSVTADLSEDEAYYWLWSTHLAAGYYDHPPMIAYWIRAGTALFGDTTFGVRFAGRVAAVLGSYFLYRASFSLFRDTNAALLAVLWLNTTLLCNAAAIVSTPDTPLSFFAILVLFALAKLVETGRGAWWYGVGAALGLAFMSKYSAVLLLPGVFLWTIGHAEGRRWFKRPEPYIGALIAAAVVAPVVWWNYGHDWVSFAKQAGHAVKDKPADALASIGELLGGQAGLATPLIFAFCVAGSFFSLVRGWNRQDGRWLLLGCTSAPVFLFFLVHAASEKIQPNWPGFVYPAAILAAVHGFLSAGNECTRQKWFAASFRLAPWLGIVFSLAAFVQLGIGALPLKNDPTARLKGWAKLGSDIEELADRQGAASILTANYATTGELAFYGAKDRPVLQIGERIRYANLPAPDEAKLKSGPALLISRHGSGLGGADAFFEGWRFVTTVTREAGFHSGEAYDVRLLLGYRGGLFGGD